MSPCTLIKPNSNGYQKNRLLAHRVAYERSWGPIPDGYIVHHLCGARSCINPFHLQAMTSQEHGQAHGRVYGYTAEQRFADDILDEYENDRDGFDYFHFEVKFSVRDTERVK